MTLDAASSIHRKHRARFEVRPLTTANWGDLVALFERPGASVPRSCWCMHYRESGRGTVPDGKRPAAARRDALRALVEAGEVPGLLGYLRGEPIGWVSLGPRAGYRRLARSPAMKPVDDRPVWSIVCFFVDARFRGQGTARALLDGALDWARARGVDLLEAYPIDKPGESVADFMWFGARSMFDAQGFVEVARRKPTRPVMRKRLARRADTGS